MIVRRPVALLVAAFLAACTNAAMTAGPRTDRATPTAAATVTEPSSGLGDRWARASFEVPEGFHATADPNANVCAPCHPAEQTEPKSLTASPSLIVAGGYTMPGPRGALWTSTDGSNWSQVKDFPAGDLSTVDDVAWNGQRFVAVGGHAADASAWSSRDGVTWHAATSSAQLSGSHMSTVAPLADGFVAAGYASDALGTHAVFWSSRDGQDWRRVHVDAARGWVKAIASGPSGLLAVGTAGERARGPAVVWTSAEGTKWQRIAELPDGVMNAVIRHASEWFAVGHDDADRLAVVWRSSDGREWRRLESQTFAEHGGRIEMRDVTETATGLAAVGLRAFGDYDTATVWLSRDGTDWTRASDDTSFEGGGISATLFHRGRLFAAGSIGWPDNFSGTIWMTPPT